MNSKYTNLNKTVPFNTINIGHMFYAHDRVWVRTSHSAASCLDTPHGCGYGVCNFMLDGVDENEPEQVHNINTHAVAEMLIKHISMLQQENKLKH